MNMSNLLSDPAVFSSKVSSVLNRNAKECGKKFLFDGRVDTCWNSDQGSPQWIFIAFEEPVAASRLQLMFQGGFAGKTCHLETCPSPGLDDLTKSFEFYPEDTNKLQIFEFPAEIRSKVFKVVFTDSTDFFGRITVYQMMLFAK